MNDERLSDDERAEEARRWTQDRPPEGGWEDTPSAVPRAGNSEAISLRLPKQQLAIIREFARREGIGYQVLIKRWLDERLSQERDRRRASRDAHEAATEIAATPASAIADAFAAAERAVRQVAKREAEKAPAQPGRVIKLRTPPVQFKAAGYQHASGVDSVSPAEVG